MWKKLGFKESPYNTNPLSVCKEDVELLVGRDKEALEFCTSLEASNQGIIIMSGAPGVGKTSFLNVQLFLLETEKSLCGPKLMGSRKLCPTQPDDGARSLAVRALDSLYRSVEACCITNGYTIPKETKKIGKWLNSKGNSGFDIGINILGFGGNLGRSVELPSINDVSFEGISDAISCITSEVVNNLKFQGAVITIDNIENLDEETLGKILISFRDTLFSTPNVWWILIGQSGLSSLVQALDPRVFERITGSGIEILPIILDELYKAISLRVSRFHSSKNGKAPLPKDVHETLFNVSFGETRYVFKYSNSICTKFVNDIRTNLMEHFKTIGETISREIIEKSLNKTMGNYLAGGQIKTERSLELLKDIVSSELSGLFLKEKERKVLKKIGDMEKARAKDFKLFAIKSMQDFSSNYLTKLWGQRLLSREQEGRAVFYRLRGISKSAHGFGLLD